jgi:hypothetical protein
VLFTGSIATEINENETDSLAQTSVLFHPSRILHLKKLLQ